LFPDAIIDKLMGDEVMALYLPDVQLHIAHDEVPALMLEHARECCTTSLRSGTW